MFGRIVGQQHVVALEASHILSGKMMTKKTKSGLCDSCDEPGGKQEYIGYGIMFCQKCIDKQLIRTPDGFRFKNSKEKSNDQN